MRQEGMHAETRSWIFLLLAYISKQRTGSLVQGPTIVKWKNIRRPSESAQIRFPDRLASHVMVYPSAVLHARVRIPLSANF